MEVLCCCSPKTRVGTAPDGLDLETREWEDSETGETGRAYVSHDVDWDNVAGFERNETEMRGKRTWREPKKKGTKRGGKKK